MHTIMEPPENFVNVVDRKICEHHKRQPWDIAYPGCCCSAAYYQRCATPEEKAANIQRQKEERERRRQHMADYDAGKIK